MDGGWSNLDETPERRGEVESSAGLLPFLVPRVEVLPHPGAHGATPARRCSGGRGHERHRRWDGPGGPAAGDFHEQRSAPWHLPACCGPLATAHGPNLGK